MDKQNNTPTANPLEVAVRDLCGKVDAYLKQGCLRSELYKVNERVKALLDTLPEQPVSEGLEEEIKRYFQGLWPGMETAEQCNTDMRFTPPAIMRLARHFYELGCRHTAEMYDNIEHERQRRAGE